MAIKTIKETVTKSIATDDLTGENVNADELTEYVFQFGDVRGKVTLTVASADRIKANPDVAALIKAASEATVTVSKPKLVKAANGKDAYGWERRAVAVALGADAKDTGGQVPANAEAKFAEAVAAGYAANGSASKPKADTPELAAFNDAVAKFAANFAKAANKK